MDRFNKKDILPLVHDILERRYGKLTLVSGQGIQKGERIGFELDGKLVNGVIKTSTGGRISFGFRDGRWSGLDDSDFVIIVAPNGLGVEEHMVSMFDQKTMRSVFEANRDAQDRAGMAHLPNWIAPFHERGRGPRGTGDGYNTKALWTEPLYPKPTSPVSPKSPILPTLPLTIAIAKQELAKTYGVSADAVEITIRG